MNNPIQLGRIGTQVDDANFRNTISKDTKDGVTKYNQIKEQIEEFSQLSVNYKVKQTLEQKSEAYVTKLEEFFRRFQEVVKQIQIKQKNFIEIETRRRDT